MGKASREEEYLRNNLGYLAEGSGGRIWFVANLLYGMVLNLLPLLCLSFLAGKALGCMYRLVHPHIDDGELTEAVIVAAAVWLGGLILAALLVVGSRRLSESCLGRRDGGRTSDPASSGHVDRSSQVITGLVVVAGVIGLLLIVVPAATIALGHLFAAIGMGGADASTGRSALEMAAMGGAPGRGRGRPRWRGDDAAPAAPGASHRRHRWAAITSGR